MNKFIGQMIEDSQRGQVEWVATSDPYTFEAEYQDSIYTLHATPEDSNKGLASLSCWEDGEVVHLVSEGTEDERQCFQLLQVVFRLNGSFRANYNKYTRNMGKSETISFYKIKKRLGFESEESHPFINIHESEYFYYSQKDDSKYIEPVLKQLETINGFVPFNEANIILISAPGATGKTAMSEVLSRSLRIPILNLSNYDAVGANSIGGLIMKEVEGEDIFVFHNGLKNGTCSMIIDGLDEASIRITHESFEAFMKDIAFFSQGAQGLPFVILGRPAVIENAVLSLEANDIKTTLLQIEPFTIEQAKKFIDVHTEGDGKFRYDQQYKNVRDYIIDELGAFFKNESDINHLVFERFIGYAPVLESIKTLLSLETNYYNLYQELQRDKKQKIGLLIDVVEKIMERERKKILDELLKPLFDKNRSEEDKESIRAKCASKEEQCCRIIDQILGHQSQIPLFGDTKLDEQYNQKMNDWLQNHPFFSARDNWFVNVVFESYVIAYLACLPDYKERVVQVMKQHNSSSYLFLYLFDELSKSKEIDILMVPYLINSFKALDRPHDTGLIEILSTEDEEQENITCELNFGREGINVDYEFTFNGKQSDTLTLPSTLSSLNVDIPLNVSVKGINIEFQSPLFIRCKQLLLSSKEVLLTDNQSKTDMVIYCDSLEEAETDGTPMLLTNRIHDGSTMRIFTTSPLQYPFTKYRDSSIVTLNDDQKLLLAFTKLRRMILMFRSHSKGTLARICSKIDSRIKKNNLGRVIIESLLEDKVLNTDNIYYYIDYERFASVIGVKYDDIRSCIINDKTRTFLKNVIKKTESV